MAATVDGDGETRFSESALYPAGRVIAIAQHAGTRSAAPAPAKRSQLAGAIWSALGWSVAGDGLVLGGHGSVEHHQKWR